MPKRSNDGDNKVSAEEFADFIDRAMTPGTPENKKLCKTYQKMLDDMKKGLPPASPETRQSKVDF